MIRRKTLSEIVGGIATAGALLYFGYHMGSNYERYRLYQMPYSVIQSEDKYFLYDKSTSKAVEIQKSSLR